MHWKQDPGLTVFHLAAGNACVNGTAAYDDIQIRAAELVPVADFKTH